LSFVENDPARIKEAEYLAEERAYYATDEVVARVGYAAICALEAYAVGQSACPPWEQLPPEKQADLIAGVNFIFDHPSAPNSAQHDAWLARNTHRLRADDPRRGGYDKLGYLGKLKIALWRNICHAFVG
jgi:hypothetical protein